MLVAMLKARVPNLYFGEPDYHVDGWHNDHRSDDKDQQKELGQ